jgi:hypothetical protein
MQAAYTPGGGGPTLPGREPGSPGGARRRAEVPPKDSLRGSWRQYFQARRVPMVRPTGFSEGGSSRRRPHRYD